MNISIQWIAITAIALMSQSLKAQGCSDAGVCSVGGMGPNSNRSDSSKLKLTAMYTYGSGEQGVTIHSAQIQLDFNVFSKLQAQIKLPYSSASGNLGSNAGLGDIIVGLSYPIRKGFGSLIPTLGMRIATGNANATISSQNSPVEKPLPMPYQTTLGTHDLMLAVAAQLKSFQIGIGVQIPIGNNLNQFNDSGSSLNGNVWNGNADAAKYFSSVQLKRGPDLVLRVEKSWRKEKIIITPGLLGIYKLAKDQQLVWISGTAGFTQIYSPIEGSNGLTLNAMLNLKYLINPRSRFLVGVASPLIIRENRPDGLTRALVATVGYEFQF